MKPFTLNHGVVQQLVFKSFYERTRVCEKRESGKQPLGDVYVHSAQYKVHFLFAYQGIAVIKI